MTAFGDPSPLFTQLSDGFQVTSADQRITVRSSNPAQQAYALTVEVRQGGGWQPFFDAGKPLLSGTHFDLLPTSYRLIEDSPERVAALLEGKHPQLGYAWDALIEARADSRWIRFRITAHLTEAISLETPEPTAAFWMSPSDDLVTLDQGPVSIYGGHSWGNSFPAAYLWTGGKEAVLFFNPTPSRWMSKDSLRRFLDYRVATVSDGTGLGLGIHALSKSGDLLPADHLVFEYFLLARERADRPSRLQSLDITVQVCADLLPATVPFPENRVAPYELTWETFTNGVIRDLMQENVSWAEIPSTWTDAPAFPEDRVETLLLHSDYATHSSRTLNLNRKDVFQVWDYACSNNFVAPWLALNRLRPDAAQRKMLLHKLDNVPMFYDPDANLMRWSAQGVERSAWGRHAMANGIEMSWENFMFNLENAKIHHAAAPADFNPAIAGKLLMACAGLVELGHNVGYVFPQWFDAFDKKATMQLDIPALGKVREPFQVGSYAYVMLEAYQYTGDSRWLDEAAKSLKYVLTEMQYSEINLRYTAHYQEAVDVPVAETFGNGYAVAAAQQLYNLTGDETYRQYARDYLNILARMAFWYKDDADATSQDLNNLGLFRAHGGHYGTCPWENIEAYLPLSVYLKYNADRDDLLFKLFNLQRITSFYFFPPTWTAQVAAPNPELYHHDCQYLPIENFYTLEFGGTHGSMGRCIYMCSQAPWNYLLYEAFAQSSDREIMVLNLDMLDGYEYAVEAVERNFVLFNPTGHNRSFILTMQFLDDADYRLVWNAGAGSRVETVSAASLTAGIPVTLLALEGVRLQVSHVEAQDRRSQIDALKSAQNAVIHAYALLQQSAQEREITAEKAQYRAALDAYRQEQYDTAREQARQVVAALREELEL
jgi:hypothetical protein